MKIKIYLSLIAILGSVNIYAQVGIGNPSPNTNTILDLTNTNNRSLLLPVPSVSPSTLTATSFNTAGMMFYYSDNLYLKTTSSFKVITPWIYDGTAVNGISSPASTPVGIGLTTTASAPMVLQVANAAADVSETSSNASIAIGLTSGAHMMIDNNEIMAKSNATTATALKLQEEAGTVEVRSSTADAGVTTVVTAYGSVDAKGKIRENGNDLLPVGSIIMWAGTTVPAGWALCDGGTYTLDAGGTVATPNLMDRFIVGADATNGTGAAVGTYTSGNTGGANTVTLGINEIPSHNHSCSGVGNHTHDINSFATDGLDHDASGGGGEQYWRANSGGPTATQGSGAHSHTIGNNGGGLAHENRPPYYALAFIYKL